MSEYRELKSRTRIITLDIETVSTTQEPSGALEGRTGRIVGIGLLIDDMTRLEPIFISDADERKILERFWSIVTDSDLLVGFNVLEFDLLFLRQRSMILQVKPSVDVNMKRYYTEDVYDLMAVWNNWGYKKAGCSLDNIAQALGVGQKTGHGYEVNDMWAKGEIDRLREYCMSDVWLEYLCYCKMRFRKPTGMPLPNAKPYDALLHAAANPQRELVPLQQKGPAPTVNGNLAPLQSAIEANVPHQSNGRDRDPIFYRQAGGEVILSGRGVFPIKKALKEVYGVWGKKISAPDEKPARFEWHMRQERFQPFAEFCQHIGTPLYAQGNGTLAVPREA